MDCGDWNNKIVTAFLSPFKLLCNSESSIRGFSPYHHYIVFKSVVSFVFVFVIGAQLQWSPSVNLPAPGSCVQVSLTEEFILYTITWVFLAHGLLLSSTLQQRSSTCIVNWIWSWVQLWAGCICIRRTVLFKLRGDSCFRKYRKMPIVIKFYVPANPAFCLANRILCSLYGRSHLCLCGFGIIHFITIVNVPVYACLAN